MSYNKSGILTALASGREPHDSPVISPYQPIQTGKRWLLFVENDFDTFSALAQLAETLFVGGSQVTILIRDQSSSSESGRVEQVDAKSHQSYSIQRIAADSKRISDMVVADTNLEGIVYAWGMSRKEASQNQIVFPFLTLTKALFSVESVPRILVITQGVQPVTETRCVLNPNGATLIGMIKSLKNEIPSLEIRYLDAETDCSLNL